MHNVKWIKLIVGMFDGASFKKIKRAKIDGVADFRDKLTAVWFELLDLGAKVNNEGLFINDEIAYKTYEDIAIMLDRTEKEIELCMEWFIKEQMIVIIDDVYSINNWIKYQNNDGLEKIREQGRIRQRKFRERQKMLIEENTNNSSNVTVTLRNANTLISNSLSNSKSNTLINKDLKDNNKELIKEVIDIFNKVCGTNLTYRSKNTNSLINARIEEGAKVEDFEKVIKSKYNEWKDNEKMKVYIRPSTLFGATNFHNYLAVAQIESGKEKYNEDRFKNMISN